jgi:predicted nucleotidyltransferase
LGTQAVNEAELEELLTPPDDATMGEAIEAFARAVRQAYGDRVRGIYLFGSRARGDHTRDSDADIAVVLRDGDWDDWKEKSRLTDIGYDALISTGADIQAFPVRAAEWSDPVLHRNPSLVRAMRAEGRAIGRDVEERS